MPLKELDVVALTEDLPEPGLRRGCTGTVVEVYTPEQVEVEFVDRDGRTYGLATVLTSQLLPLLDGPARPARAD